MDTFERMQREGRLQVERIETRAALDTFLARGGAHVVHFACHGHFDQEQPGRSLVMLGGDSLRPDDVTGRYLAFGQSRPLVFLNACDTGGGASGSRGWRAGRRPSCGPRGWEAHRLHVADHGCTGLPVRRRVLRLPVRGPLAGEAMRQARLAIGTSGDATYLTTRYTRILVPA